MTLPHFPRKAFELTLEQTFAVFSLKNELQSASVQDLRCNLLDTIREIMLEDNRFKMSIGLAASDDLSCSQQFELECTARQKIDLSHTQLLELIVQARQLLLRKRNVVSYLKNSR